MDWEGFNDMFARHLGSRNQELNSVQTELKSMRKQIASLNNQLEWLNIQMEAMMRYQRVVPMPKRPKKDAD
jgi:peptidoglycan hydrolase CwlO-like protein